MKKASEKLDIMKLPEKDQVAYKQYVANLRNEASKAFTLRIDTEYLLNESINEAKKELIIEFWKLGVSIQNIAIATKYSESQIEEIVEDYQKNTPSV